MRLCSRLVESRFHLIVELDIFAFVLPLGELLLVKLLLQLGLHVGQFLLLRPPLVDELLGPAHGASFKNYI